jgi:inner membrane protein
MSSFIGHTLAGFTVYTVTDKERTRDRYWLWLVCTIFIASMPDIDYLIPGLKLSTPLLRIRTTHSFLGATIAPLALIFILYVSGWRGQRLIAKSYQLIAIGLSHLLLDLLVGVFPLPLFYPFSTETFRLPFGILPSAGRIQFTNYLFYRNLLIEIGVLLPLYLISLLVVRDSPKSPITLLTITIGLAISGYFMFWASTLSR